MVFVHGSDLEPIILIDTYDTNRYTNGMFDLFVSSEAHARLSLDSLGVNAFIESELKI